MMPDCNSILRCLKNVPILNLFVIFVKPVTFERLEKMMSMYALIDALMISIVCTILCGVNFDEIQQAMARYNNIGDTSWSFCNLGSPSSIVYKDFCNQVSRWNGYANVSSQAPINFDGNPFAMIYSLPTYATATLSMFSISLLCTLFLYIGAINALQKMEDKAMQKEKPVAATKTEAAASMGSVAVPNSGRYGISKSITSKGVVVLQDNIDGNGHQVVIIVDSKDDETAKKVMPEKWWFYAGILSFFCFATMTAGVVTFFFTMHRIIFIKFPSYYMESYGVANDMAGNAWHGDPQHNYSSWAYVVVCLSVAFALLLMSVARFAIDSEVDEIDETGSGHSAEPRNNIQENDTVVFLNPAANDDATAADAPQRDDHGPRV